MKTPLAWKNLTHDKRRLMVAMAGIAFAVLLMFVQVGFENALFNSQVRLIDRLEGDLMLTSAGRFALAAEKRFPIEKIYQARSEPGVTSASPLYTELTTSVLRNLMSGRPNKGYPIRTIGMSLGQPLLRSGVETSDLVALRAPRTALIDRASKKPNFDFPIDDIQQLSTAPAELGGKSVQLVGAFDMGADFVHDGNLLMSVENFAYYFPLRRRGGDPLSVVDLGLIKVADNVDVYKVRDRLASRLGAEVHVWTRQQLRQREVRFWRSSTPIGTIFSAGKIIGFVVGVVICYQVIFSDIADHMPEFATLKAMGYQTGYFLRLIVAEALWLSFFGFVPGALVSTALYAWLANQTGLHMQMTLDCLAMVLAVTVAMCVVSGMLAVRKLLTADPASLF